MRKCILIFTALDGREYVNIDLHRFGLLSENLQNAKIFDDEGYGKTIPGEMARRGVWDDFGIFMHTWELFDSSSSVERVLTTERFTEKLKHSKVVRCVENLTTVDDQEFLNPARYAVKVVELIIKN
jgi:hypothetical protein